MLVVAVDVGGTFTDLVIQRDEGTIDFFKILTTPRQPELAVIEGLRRLGKPIDTVLHATTIATNALLGQMGLELPKIAIMTTKGFRDVIEIGRQNRPNLYDVFFEKPRSLVPRELRFEVDERIDFQGKVLKPADSSEITEIGSQMMESGVETVAICYLHAYANPTNERLTKDVISKNFGYISASHDIAPEPREYERTSTTVVNALLMPIVARYVGSLNRSLGEFGATKLHLMASSGGLIDSAEASVRPVQLIESGPAAGTIAAAEFAKMIGVSKTISFDMGGTTAKAGTVLNELPEITTEYEVGGQVHHGRIVRGSGYPIRFPFVDLAEVSAGGGSIIWKDEAGALRIGPSSAGADPGAICYGRGGTQPTLTDANLVLGRLGEELLGGVMKLDKKAAVRGLATLGDSTQLAYDAITLANLEMSRAIRLVTVERGLDPSEFTLMAFGGAGPQHAMEVADELAMNSVLVPPEPSGFSALGMLLADSKFEARASFPVNLEEGFERLEKELGDKAGPGAHSVRYAEARYAGQGWELMIPVGRPAALDSIVALFEDKHSATYGFRLDEPVEVVTIRVFAILPRNKPRLPEIVRPGGDAVAKGRRKVFFGEWLDTSIYWRDDLPAGFSAPGPLLIEEYGSTTLVPPKWRVAVGSLGSLMIER